jgi:hypothetical protein
MARCSGQVGRIRHVALAPGRVAPRIVGGLCSLFCSSLSLSRLFIVEKDITLQRFWETAHICGFVPPHFLHAVKSPGALAQVQMNILEAIKSSEGIKDTIDAVAEGLVVQHCAFVVSPRHLEYRSLVCCLFEPISEYAMDAVIMTLDKRSEDLYKHIQGFPLTDAFRRKIREHKVRASGKH